MGPRAYVAHLTSGPRLPFTAVYLGSIAMTIYFAVGVSPEPPGGRPTKLTAIASFDHLDSSLFDHTTGGLGMVSSQLLSHGKHWPQVCSQSRGRPPDCLDERLIKVHSATAKYQTRFNRSFLPCCFSSPGGRPQGHPWPDVHNHPTRRLTSRSSLTPRTAS